MAPNDQYWQWGQAMTLAEEEITRRHEKELEELLQRIKDRLNHNLFCPNEDKIIVEV